MTEWLNWTWRLVFQPRGAWRITPSFHLTWAMIPQNSKIYYYVILEEELPLCRGCIVFLTALSLSLHSLFFMIVNRIKFMDKHCNQLLKYSPLSVEKPFLVLSFCNLYPYLLTRTLASEIRLDWGLGSASGLVEQGHVLGFWDISSPILKRQLRVCLFSGLIFWILAYVI